MTRPSYGIILTLCLLAATGCVTKETHTQTLSELEAARKASATTGSELDALKKKSAADLASWEQEKARLDGELAASRNELNALRATHDQAVGQNEELKRHGDMLQAKADGLQQDLTGRTRALDDANGRIASLENDKNQLSASLTEAKDHARDLETKLGAEVSQAAALREDKQRLLSGTTTAQDEIARLQKRAGELETEAARVADLTRRLDERDQEIGKLRQASADRDALAGKVSTLTDDLTKASREQQQLLARLQEGEDRLKAETAEKTKLAQERDQFKQSQAQLSQEQQQLLARLQQEEDRLKAGAAEKAKLEQERAAKEEEVRRLTKASEDLTKSLKDEINKGNITIQQVRDRLTINMVDRVLFDSGQAQVKPAGLKVLKQVSDVVKGVPDKQIRIEGHTDNVPIGSRLKDKFASNWELSTARATSVVRYLIDEGGVDRGMLSAAGYADTHPVAPNETDEGKASNRRIEIVLYPKDLSEIVNQMKPDGK